MDVSAFDGEIARCQPVLRTIGKLEQIPSHIETSLVQTSRVDEPCPMRVQGRFWKRFSLADAPKKIETGGAQIGVMVRIASCKGQCPRGNGAEQL